jgi:hypothetical protein
MRWESAHRASDSSVVSHVLRDTIRGGLPEMVLVQVGLVGHLQSKQIGTENGGRVAGDGRDFWLVQVRETEVPADVDEGRDVGHSVKEVIADREEWGVLEACRGLGGVVCFCDGGSDVGCPCRDKGDLFLTVPADTDSNTSRPCTEILDVIEEDRIHERPVPPN